MIIFIIVYFACIGGQEHYRITLRKMASWSSLYIFIENYLCNYNLNENARVSHLTRVNGVQNSPNNFDLKPVTLTYDI